MIFSLTQLKSFTNTAFILVTAAEEEEESRLLRTCCHVGGMPRPQKGRTRSFGVFYIYIYIYLFIYYFFLFLFFFLLEKALIGKCILILSLDFCRCRASASSVSLCQFCQNTLRWKYNLKWQPHFGLYFHFQNIASSLFET